MHCEMDFKNFPSKIHIAKNDYVTQRRSAERVQFLDFEQIFGTND